EPARGPHRAGRPDRGARGRARGGGGDPPVAHRRVPHLLGDRPVPAADGGGLVTAPAAMPGGPGAAAGAAQKPKNFRATFRRLIRELGPEKFRFFTVLTISVIGIAMSAVGPLIMGRATDVLFSGAISRTLAPGTTKDQAVEILRS